MWEKRILKQKKKTLHYFLTFFIVHEAQEITLSVILTKKKKWHDAVQIKSSLETKISGTAYYFIQVKQVSHEQRKAKAS